MAGLIRRCPCIRPQVKDVTTLDYRHCSLEYVPSDVFTYERTLEELSIDANQIRELPRELFCCHGLRKLCVSDNEIISIPPAIASLICLEELDFSKNGVVDLPDNIKSCKCLRSIEASVNPLGKLPEGFTQLLNLSELYLNDTFLDYLPGSFGRLNKLKILEIRENHLKTLPKSMSRLTLLERLDIGNNEFTELPEVIGNFVSLLELWCDSNQIQSIPGEIGNLKQMMYFDASKNRIENIPVEIEGCISLADLHLSTNLLHQLPESIGRLSNMTTLKIDDNRLTCLPFSIGGLVSLSELNASANDLEEIPPSIGLLRHLRTFYADENYILELPPELGSCNGLTVLSLRSNNLEYIPEEIGRIPRLRVLNLSDNKLRYLPYNLTRLKQLQALWLAENQTKPLVRLQTDVDPETGVKVLTCYLLPQQSDKDREAEMSERGSFHPSLWEEERLRRQQIHFDFGDDPEQQSRLERTPTPYPKEMKHRSQHMKNLALKQLGMANGEVEQGTEPVTSEEVTVGGAKPTSPLMGERHHLLRADKEKMQKDKTKMRSSSLEKIEAASSPRDPTKSKSHDDILRSKDDGGFSDTSAKRRSSNPSPGSGRKQNSSQPLLGGPYNQSNQSLQSTGASSHLNSSVHSYPNDRHTAPSSYGDFLRGLHVKGAVVDGLPSRDVYRPSSAHGKRTHRHTGYESDTGYYRNSNGYQSDTGYRSEVSYRSDNPVYVKRGSRNGYHSDREGYGSKHRHEGGYASDMDIYNKMRGRSNRHSAPLYQPMGPHYPKQSEQSRQQSNKAGLAYNNIPMSKRTTIRNDEMYEQYPGGKTPARGSGVQQAPPRSETFPPATPQNTANFDQLPINKLSLTPSRNSTPTAWEDTSRREEPIREEITNGSSDDDQWKAQLQKASVKLHKSPSDKVKQLQSPGDISQDPYGDHSTLTSPTKPLEPPPYPAAPPYSPPKSRRVSELANRSNTNSPNSSHSQQSWDAASRAHMDTSRASHMDSPHGSGHVDRSLPLYQSSPKTKRPDNISSDKQNITNSPLSSTKRLADKGYASSPHSKQQQHAGSKEDVYNQSQMSQHLNQSSRSYGTPHKGPPMPGYHGDTSLRLSQYDKDVAVYKQLEPPSQVSSSTDSGYGHGHVYDRSHNEVSLRLQHGASPSSMHSPPSSQTPSPGYQGHPAYSREATPQRDSTYSREATPQRDPTYSREATPHRESAYSRESIIHRTGTPDKTLSNSYISQERALSPHVFRTTITKNPGLGFSIAGGQGSQGNPFRLEDMGIFITKVQTDGPASRVLRCGDKILEVNDIDFRNIQHTYAVEVLRSSGHHVNILLERYQ